jgi:hypothetical protein
MIKERTFMKNAALKISLIALFAGFIASPAFAIDQVKLTNGQVIEGTVLNDVTNLYVDVRLVGGETKRIPHNEVASVDRDVPSRKDRDLMGNQSTGFISLTAGGFYRTENILNNHVLFDYGIKAGVISGQIGESKLGFALSYDRASTSEGSATAAINDLNLQMLFMRVNNSGFYFGPNVGLAIITASNSVASDSTSKLEAGLGLGYEFFLSDGFSIGPDVRYEHLFIGDNGGSTSTAYNVLKFALAGNFHF